MASATNILFFTDDKIITVFRTTPSQIIKLKFLRFYLFHEHLSVPNIVSEKFLVEEVETTLGSLYWKEIWCMQNHLKGRGNEGQEYNEAFSFKIIQCSCDPEGRKQEQLLLLTFSGAAPPPWPYTFEGRSQKVDSLLIYNAALFAVATAKKRPLSPFHLLNLMRYIGHLIYLNHIIVLKIFKILVPLMLLVLEKYLMIIGFLYTCIHRLCGISSQNLYTLPK